MSGKVYGVLTKTIGGIVEGVRAYYRYKQSCRELSALDDRQLADIGIPRSMIRSVAVTGYHPLAEIGPWRVTPASNGEYPKRAA